MKDGSDWEFVGVFHDDPSFIWSGKRDGLNYVCYFGSCPDELSSTSTNMLLTNKREYLIPQKNKVQVIGNKQV